MEFVKIDKKNSSNFKFARHLVNYNDVINNPLAETDLRPILIYRLDSEIDETSQKNRRSRFNCRSKA